MIFFDIDTQIDFMVPSGALYVPGAESVQATIGQLLELAGRKGVATISTRCAHTPDDVEFSMFPPHCIEGSPGAARLFAALPLLKRHEIGADAEAKEGAQILPGTHYVVSKRVFDLFSNQWLAGLREAGAFRDEECVIFGVATDYCVRACVLGLAAAGARLLIVTDAIAGVAPATTNEALSEFRAMGVGMTTAAELITRLTD